MSTFSLWPPSFLTRIKNKTNIGSLLRHSCMLWVICKTVKAIDMLHSSKPGSLGQLCLVLMRGFWLGERGSHDNQGGLWLVERGHMTTRVKGQLESDVMGTGSGMGNRWPVAKRDRGLRGHVIWDGKPLTSRKKGSWAQMKKREDISCRRHDVPSG